MGGKTGSRRGRGRALTLKDISPATVTRAKKDALSKEAAIIRFMYAARQLHPFKGSGSQCKQCWGWYDDPRHVGDSSGSTK